jgi:hypothetical protein
MPKNKLLTNVVLACSLSLILLVACSQAASTPESVSMLPEPDQIQPSWTPPPPAVPAPNTAVPTALPSSTASPTLPPASPTPEPTHTPEPTPTDVPLPTPTPTPEGILPGYYPVGGCTTIGVYVLYTIANDMEFCVLSVEVYEDGRMSFLVSWTADFKRPGFEVVKRKDTNNTNMYILDNLGNRYNHIEVGGDAARDLGMKHGDVAVGSFVFPKAAPGATIFEFVDADHDHSVPTLILTNPKIIKQTRALALFPYELTYKVEKWTPLEEGSDVLGLSHLLVPGCTLEEWAAVEIQGKLINTIAYGKVEYQIYRTQDPENSRNIREYLAVSGLLQLASPPQPLFRAAVPYEGAELCANDLSELLSSLAAVEP